MARKDMLCVLDICVCSHIYIYIYIYGSVPFIRRDRTFAQKGSTNKYLAGTKQIYATHVDFVGIAVGAAGSTVRQSSKDLPICGMRQNIVLGMFLLMGTS